MLGIGIDIGGTKVAAGVVDEAGNLLNRLQQPSPTKTPQDVEDVIVACVNQLRREFPEVASVGVGAAGWVDREQAIIRFSPHLAWRNEPLRDQLAQRIELPVLIDNDANAAAWAEFRFGAGRGADVMVCTTLGTGIGGAMIINGELFRGQYGMAGEWGHMTIIPDGHWCPCGNRGCWEQYASGNALVRDARALLAEGSPHAAALTERVGRDPTRLTGPDITAAAVAGDAMAANLIADVGMWLGRGLANLAAALDPEIFVIGGGVSEAGELLLVPARAAFERTLTGRGFRQSARIVAAELRNDAGLIGAADLARHAVDDPPGEDRGFWPRRRRRPRRKFREVLESWAAPVTSEPAT